MSDDQKPATRSLSPQAIHLLRTSMQANLRLSQMADQKASLLMGASFVVFTLAVGQAGRGFASMALVVLGTFAFVSACLSVAAVLPRFSRDPVADTEGNILFFGVFTTLEEKDFADQVIARLDNDEDIYRLMLRDIYQNGQVLQRRKYRLLGWSYRIFLVGLTLALFVFLYEQRELFSGLF
ncbi:Pycsar system effector family protein [Qipengyuania sp. CAU 1752]